jgi:hypothetical protein
VSPFLAESSSSILNVKTPTIFPEDEGSKFLRNTATRVKYYNSFTLLKTAILSNTDYKILKFHNESRDITRIAMNSVATFEKFEKGCSV